MLARSLAMAAQRRTGAEPGPTREVDVAALETLEVRRFLLRVTAGPDVGTCHTASGRVVVGTHPSANIQLGDPTLSRFHCEIEIVDGRALVRDLGSRNGTFVDGVSVLQAHLRPGALLTLGKSQLRFDPASDFVSVPLSERAAFGLAVGAAPPMRAIFAVLERAAASDATILLLGETGTGKDVLAESIHRESPRRSGPFMVVDCGALPANLLESELFGHERGAFTGADRARMGAFEAASGGTLFLDEIGDMHPELQPKLLGALERREIQRVGSPARIPIDVRVVAATSRPLTREVNEKRFRSDLYYRLSVVALHVPPLRQRMEDLPLLVEALLEAMEAGAHPGAAALRSAPFLMDLQRHEWPGNVRELRNHLEQCLALGPSSRQPLTDDPGRDHPPMAAGEPLRVAREKWLSWFERHYLEDLLARHENNVSACARAAGIDRMHLYRLLWRRGLR
jgi:transcriptional regulator with PAS, ATPase and Fis domain